MIDSVDYEIRVPFYLHLRIERRPPGGISRTMTKLEVILQSPDALAGSFAAKPKVMYRAGTRYCRIEEAADPERRIHALMIINEPDYWMVNLLAKTARHGVDPGPTLNCRLPMFSDSTAKSTGDPSIGADLEFGLEFEYSNSKGATSKPGAVLQNKQTNVYRLQTGSSNLAFFTYGTPERPLAVARHRGDRNEIYWYSGNGHLPFEPGLFAKPEGVQIEETKP